MSEAIDDERGSFRGEPLIKLMPNYYQWNNMVYRHIPAGALWKKAKVEDVKWTEGIIDLLYMDPPWKLNCADPTRGPLLDYGKQSLREVKDILQQYPCRLLAIWTVNFVYLDMLRFLKESNFEIVQQVEWIKETGKGNLAKSYGYYLQHSKESLLIAVNQKDNTIEKRAVPSFFRAKQVRPSGKPPEAQLFLETWFPDYVSRVELYARNNNLRPGWKSIGLQLEHEGLEAVHISLENIPEEFRTESTGKTHPD